MLEAAGAPVSTGHPFLRRKIHTERRSELPIESAWVFYPRRVREVTTTYGGLIAYAWQVRQLYRRVRGNTRRPDYRYFDQAMEPSDETVEQGADASPEVASAAA